jgi:hypothetical protein
MMQKQRKKERKKERKNERTKGKKEKSEKRKITFRKEYKFMRLDVCTKERKKGQMNHEILHIPLK